MKLDLVPIQEPTSSSVKLDLVPITNTSAPLKGQRGDSLPLPLAKGYAVASNFGQGAIDSAQQLGSLARDVLTTGYNAVYGKDNVLSKGVKSLGKQGGEVTDKVKEYLQPHTYAEQKALDDSPRVGPLARTVGYMGGSLAGNIPGSTALSEATQAGLSKVAPMIAKSPAAAGAISQSILGAGLGASSAGEGNRLEGAAKGAILGGLGGGASGYLGGKATRSSDIIDYEIKNMQSTNIDPTSIAGHSRLVKALKDGGVDLSKDANMKTITNGIAEHIQKAGPLEDLEAPAAITISNLAKTNYKAVTDKMNAAKGPLLADKSPIVPQNATTAFAEAGAKIKTPEVTKAIPALPKQASFDELWTVRQELDQVINSTRIQAGSKPLKYRNSLVPLKEMRDAITDDLSAFAESKGLGQNWADANSIYKNEVLPFQAFRTKSGKMLDPQDTLEAMKKVNTLMNPKASPNMVELEQVAKSLGPDGHKLVGQAMLQNIYQKSVNADGEVIGKTFFTELKKAKKSGLADTLWTKDTRDAAKGIQAILRKSDEVNSLGSPQATNPGFVSKFLDYATKNRFAISLLEKIGSSSTPAKASRAMIQKILTAGIVLPPADQQ